MSGDFIAAASLSIDVKSANITAEWLALLLHIRDVLGSNFDPETGYRD
jgi:hypothetical protein